jgi:predicted GIY-YIG superfamily endonuclease
MTGCYLIHFNTPYTSPNGKKTISHYLGWSSDITARLAHHANGTGARVMEVIHEAGITFTCARQWKGATRTDERHMKNRHNHRALCPICHGQITSRKAA